MGNGKGPKVLVSLGECSRPVVGVLLAGLLVAACGGTGDQPVAPQAPLSPELAAMQPELERVMRRLEELDHRGMPRQSAGLTAAALRVQVGPVADNVFVAMADGGEEVPQVSTGASAAMALILDPRRGEILFSLLHGVIDATAAHIHRGPAGVNGPVVVALDHRRRLSFGFARLSAPDVALLQAGGLYTNVHSRRFPNGEVRGQLLRLGEALFTATMSGAEEVPPRDSTGSGSLAVILNSQQDRFRASGGFQGLTTPSTVAHIHAAPVGINGAIRFELTISPTGMTAGSLSAVQAVTATDVAQLDAGELYVNVHSTAFPAGELRGQLNRR